MRIAIPLAQGALAAHFGHCEQFALVDVDEETKTVVHSELVQPPPHEPGAFPSWLAEQGANVIIAGGMGTRAQNLFASQNIEVAVGAPAQDAETLALAYVNGNLSTGPNVCDH